METNPLHRIFKDPIELIFRRIDGLAIAMDVYIPTSATKENPAPIFLWWHGMLRTLPSDATTNDLEPFRNRWRTTSGMLN